jgi:hypothetical protein
METTKTLLSLKRIEPHFLGCPTSSVLTMPTELPGSKIIQFNGYLLTCRLNSTMAYYKASTNTRQNSINTQNRTLTNKIILQEN